MSKLLAMLMNKKYTRLEYIESTGTQYIDTEYIANENTEIIDDIEFTNISVGRNGSITASDGNAYRFYYGVISNKFVGANSTKYNHSISNADTNRHTFKLDKNGLYIDDILVYSNNGAYPTSDLRNLYLFATNDVGSANYFTKCKRYSCIIKENNIVVHNLIPVIRNSDNEIGMFDRVSEQFFGNAGTGSFIGA